MDPIALDGTSPSSPTASQQQQQQQQPWMFMNSLDAFKEFSDLDGFDHDLDGASWVDQLRSGSRLERDRS